MLQEQLTTNAQYKDILRKDEGFENMLKNHYIKNALVDIPTTNDESSKISEMFNNVTSIFPHFGNYFDFKGKNQLPNTIETDFMKYLYTVPGLLGTTTKYLNVDYLKDLVWPYEKEEKEPSEETVQFMTAIMDQATHLVHYNKPHPDSPVIFVVAEHDRYIPRECYKVTPPHIYGKQTEVRTIDTGHVLAILQHHHEFRTAIKDGFVKLGCKF